MKTILNFSAGPAMLPPAVIERAREEMSDWHGCGMSIMEVSHRGPQFAEVARNSEANLRTLLGLSDEFAVLFLQGGATTQFAAVPMNLAVPGQHVAYVNTGSWSKKAIIEARKFCEVDVIADAADSGYNTVPAEESWASCEDASYLHYTANETIGGVEFHSLPNGTVPLVSDMSSNFLSRPVDLSRFALVYAGAQKNIGPAGLTLVIVRRELIAAQKKGLPSTLDYHAMSAAGSMLNTPPTFAWYMAGLVFEWLIEQGGLAAVGRVNDEKAQMLYRFIDASGFYSNPVTQECRSRMNVPFVLAEPSLDGVFLEQAAEAGFQNLKGHRSVGGMRASIYNAMPVAGVSALIDFMKIFQERHG